jgi:molybdenum cofactor cytidylyltransferase
MGRPKAGLPFGGRSALGLILETCARAGLPPAVVVAGAHPAAVAEAAAQAPGEQAQVVVNPRWAEGRATSIQAGLDRLPAGSAALLWPVDACLPGPEVLAALLAAREAAPARAAWVPSHGRRRGHPVLLGPLALERLRALDPDAPARGVIRALSDEGLLEHVEVADPAVLMNMNTPEDHARWVATWRDRRAEEDGA